jgi:predicted lipid-binding transport protein (Tim44 family)
MAAGFLLAMAAQCADAARLGGGKSMGTQRSITQSQRQAVPPSNQAAPAQAQAPAQAAPAGNRWMGPLAGLAAGLGLGWLFAHGGMGGSLAPILMVMLLLGAGFMLMRMLSRPRVAATPYGAYPGGAPRPVNYQGLGNETVAAPPPSQIPGNDWGGQPAAPAAVAPSIPPGFDVAGFIKQAKLNFIRLQEANDRGDLETLRDVATDTLFDSLSADLRSRTGPQHTDVVTLDATLLEVVTENGAHWASVKFTGQIREQPGAAPSSFAEVWHLTKPLSGNVGWLIAGIEQIS